MEISRRGVLLGCIAVTVTASGLVIPSRARAGLFDGIGAALAGVVHTVTQTVSGVANLVQSVAPPLINEAATLAGQALNIASPIFDLGGLSQGINGILTNQSVQQAGILCSNFLQDTAFTALSTLSRNPYPTDPTDETRILNDPNGYLNDNSQAILSHVLTYLTDALPYNTTAYAGSNSASGPTPNFTPFGVPIQGGTNGSGFFPTLLSAAGAANSIDLAAGGDGLLSLLGFV